MFYNANINKFFKSGTNWYAFLLFTYLNLLNNPNFCPFWFFITRQCTTGNYIYFLHHLNRYLHGSQLTNVV
jgi:hypothetical protein